MYPFSDFSIMPQNEPWNEYFLINLKVQKTRNKLHINYNIKNKKENLRKINSQTTKTSTLGSCPSHTKKRKKKKKRNSKNARARHRRIFKHFLRIRAGGPPALEGRARARARARAKYPGKFFLIEVPWLILNLEMKIRNRSLPASKTPTPAPSMTHFEPWSEHKKCDF